MKSKTEEERPKTFWEKLWFEWLDTLKDYDENIDECDDTIDISPVYKRREK